MKKTFDTVEIVREIREKHYEETKNMSWEERKKLIKEIAGKVERRTTSF